MFWTDPDIHTSCTYRDPLQGEKPDPDPHQSQNLIAVEAQNGASEGRGHSQWRRGGSNGTVEDL